MVRGPTRGDPVKKFALALLVLAAGSQSAWADHTRVTYPNVIGVEAFGRGLLFGVTFDRVVNDDLVAGVAYGTTSLNDVNGVETGRSTGLVPVYMNYYFSREGGSLFGTVGATFVTSSSNANNNVSNVGGVKFSSSPVIPTIGVGFEERSDTGFLFRVAAYGIFGKSYAPWFGFTFGYGF